MMSIRRPRPLPERRPHPDPRVEARLQQVISLRRACARNEQLLDQYRDDTGRINRYLRDHPHYDGAPHRHDQITRLQAETARLNAETADLHERIGKVLEQLSDDELLWLEAD